MQRVPRTGWVKRASGSSDTPGVKLIACKACHAQYDVTSMVPGSEFACRCGAVLEATPPVARDAMVRRCTACGAVAKESDERCDYCRAEIVQMPQRGSLICPECMARNLDDARFCLACGIGFEPQIPLQNVPELRCPCCERWMATSEVAGLIVHECPKCHGLWAPDDVFGSLVDRATAVARERAARGEDSAPRVEGGNPAAQGVEYRRCPACDALMGRRNFRKRSGVIVDQCHQHGTWLDANELERIAGFVLSGRADSAANAERLANHDREREAARAAAIRMQTRGSASSESERSIFSTRRDGDPIASILDLLVSILN